MWRKLNEGKGAQIVLEMKYNLCKMVREGQTDKTTLNPDLK